MRRVLLLGLMLSVVSVGVSPVVGEEETHPFDCPIRALLADDDVGHQRIYDGIRRGLEQANMDRICREDLGDDAEEILQRLEADPPPLLFVIGPKAASLLGRRLASVPRVYVDTAWLVNGEELPAAPAPRAPARVVRNVTPAVRIAGVLRALWDGRPRALLSWPTDTKPSAARARDLGTAAHFHASTDLEEVDLLLHVRLGGEDSLARLPRLLEIARTKQIPLVSDDLAHWRRGGAVLVVPHHFLLGRVAAEEGRQLLLQDEAERQETVGTRTMQVSEVRVDLGAAKDQGLSPPVSWLAGVDYLRYPRTGQAR